MRGRSAYLTHLEEEEEVVFLSLDGCYEKEEEEEEADFLSRIPFSLLFLKRSPSDNSIPPCITLGGESLPQRMGAPAPP